MVGGCDQTEGCKNQKEYFDKTLNDGKTDNDS